MKKVRLGIIGIGNMGMAHFGNILSRKCPEIEVTAVADLVPARLEMAKTRAEKAHMECPDIPEVATFTDASELIHSGLVDAIVVAVPHYDHPRYCIEGLKAGLHVMSEKPAGVYCEQVRELMAEADRHPDLRFGLMFNQRTSSVFGKMRDIIQSGVMGQIRRTSWIITSWYRTQQYYDSGAWRATWSGEGGGVLLNQCPHNLDLWQWVCGMPSKVKAQMHFGKWHDIEVEDDVSAYVEYPNGATGVFITSTGDFPGTNRLEVVLDGGMLITDGATLTMYKANILDPEFVNKKDPFKYPTYETVQVDCEGYGSNDHHIGVLNAFAASILHGAPMIADGREGVNSLTISNAMHLSAWLDRTIELPLDDALYKEELMKRVKTSRRKEDVESILADVTGTY